MTSVLCFPLHIETFQLIFYSFATLFSGTGFGGNYTDRTIREERVTH